MSYSIIQDDHTHSGLNASLALVTPPTQEPVTIDELKAQVWLDDDNDAQVSLATKMIKAARADCENWCSRSFAPQTYKLTLDRFPLDSGDINLRKPPVTSVTSITYIDTDGHQQTLSPSLYQVDLNPNAGRIAPAPNTGWPNTADGIGRVEITYVAGYTAENLPPNAWIAILNVAAGYFENRYALGDKQLFENPRIQALLWQLRVV